MSRSKQHNQPSTLARAPAQRAVRRPAAQRPTELAQTDLARHLDLVATIGLLHSLFSSQSPVD